MTLAATFLGGAKSRLLPASVPFRFFGAAAIFHVLMWLVMLMATDEIVRFRGGLGPALAAVHLLTLGVLTTTVIGASVQLLPVATRRAMSAVWPINLVFWLAVPGITLLVAGMYVSDTAIVVAGATTTTAGLLLFAALLADNLRRAGSMPVVGVFGWTALAAFVALIAIGLILAFNYDTGWLHDHAAVALAHAVLGGFGFMGMLVLGFSQILVPMFALAAAPEKKPSIVVAALSIAAVALGVAGALVGNFYTLTAAAAAGLIAAGLHLWLMLRVLKTGMRKRLGLSFVLVRVAWAMLPATLIVGLAAIYGYAGPNGPTLFGILLFGGWLLTFLLGILQRIVPFLASMHATQPATGAPPLLSQIAVAWPLRVHAVFHCLAILGLALAIALDNVAVARLASAAGLLGAIAFAWFMADVVVRLYWPAASRTPR
jgi:hypothetical protein